MQFTAWANSGADFDGMGRQNMPQQLGSQQLPFNKDCVERELLPDGKQYAPGAKLFADASTSL